ncbi:hypothetical protein DFH08DRAFT_836739 [Mycena albidolilacea]|uniref:Uncharacterized protein n=1 Tax=Mycena albidolilacea TaxID=1033008 RepID=A0AAD7ASY1_9AGAR|nr:hypothetical protein DFH08DRAFT_836739 [Mycena albidolilacea]
MAPGPFLWLLVGVGLGSWWSSNKRFNVDCQFHRSALPPIPNHPEPQQKAQPEPVPAGNYQPSTYWNNTPYNHDWEQERARVRQFSRTAEDTVTELSEATLNTILQATEALKAKMAEHRALREEERRLEEAQRRSSPRLI